MYQYKIKAYFCLTIKKCDNYWWMTVRTRTSNRTFLPIIVTWYMTAVKLFFPLCITVIFSSFYLFIQHFCFFCKFQSTLKVHPALDCYLLTFLRWKCCIQALTVRRCKIFVQYYQQRQLLSISGRCEVWFIWNIVNKNYRTSATRGPSLVQKNAARLHRGDVGPERCRTRS